MSCTQIFAFRPNGDAYLYGEIANAWGGAMAVWSALERKYLPQYIPEYVKSCYWYYHGIPIDNIEKSLGYLPSRLTSGSAELQNEIWELGQNPKVAMKDRIVLYTTYNNALVQKEDLPKVIDAFRKFEGQTSLPAQACILEKAYNDPEVTAIGWNQTSVSADNWGNFGGYDEENNCEIPYNYVIGERHFWIFAPNELEV